MKLIVDRIISNYFQRRTLGPIKCQWWNFFAKIVHDFHRKALLLMFIRVLDMPLTLAIALKQKFLIQSRILYNTYKLHKRNKLKGYKSNEA